MWSSGEAVVLQTNLLKGNQQIRIHPSSHLKYPAVLPSGSVGEIIENSERELLLKFMLRKPTRWEQPFWPTTLSTLRFLSRSHGL
jgi:hypothetical protein